VLFWSFLRYGDVLRIDQFWNLARGILATRVWRLVCGRDDMMGGAMMLLVWNSDVLIYVVNEFNISNLSGAM